jgi:hypothetical protein
VFVVINDLRDFAGIELLAVRALLSIVEPLSGAPIDSGGWRSLRSRSC